VTALERWEESLHALLSSIDETLEAVPPDERARIEEEAASLLREGLARAFPGRDLRVDRDGNGFKIHGDLSLGAGA